MALSWTWQKGNAGMRVGQGAQHEQGGLHHHRAEKAQEVCCAVLTDSVNNETWADLLGSPGVARKKFYYRPAAVSVGVSDGYALPSDVDESRFELIRLHRSWFIGSTTVFAEVLAALI